MTRPFVLVQIRVSEMSEAQGPSGDKTKRLLEIVSTEILPVDQSLDEDTDLFEAGLDSMSTMQLLIRIESEFGARIRVGDVTRDTFSSVRKIAALLP